eukprot:Phypoly_transcript_18620.p1 GENE.Phypoly_transcript_18620~~Phypoly_transcript_18620.p1  ORF type:complete len:233 (+),score=36.56 Phypoly_transcript_18620:47-700(+)
MKVEFFFDIVSIYSYYAFEIIERYKNAWNLDITYRPLFLGGVMAGANNKPPATVPAKGVYMMNNDIPRLNDYFKMKAKVPSNFPGVSLLAMRTLTAIQAKFPEKLVQSIRHLFEASFTEDRDVFQKEILSEELEKVGFTKEQVLELINLANSNEIKQKLKETTEEAVERGAFGAPSMFWQKDANSNVEFFFGSDRFHVIAHMYGLKFNGAYPANSKL